jgi:O-antigen ligase
MKALILISMKNLFKGMPWYDIGFELCVWAILALVPLAFSSEFYLSFEFPKVLIFREFVYLMAFFFMVKLAAGRDGGGFRLPSVFKSRVFRWLLILVPAVFVLTTLFSVEPLVSFWGNYFRQQGLFSYLHYGAFIMMVLMSFDVAQYRRALGAAFVGLGVALVYGVAQRFGFLIGNWNVDTFLGRVFATFGHPNYFSLYVLILFFPLVAWMVSAVRRRGWWSVGISGVLIGLSLMNFVLTKGRASILGLFVGGVLFLILMGLYLKDRRVVFAALIPPLVLALMVGSSMGRFDLQGENLRSIETRLVMWPSVMEMAIDSPVYGFGMETFSQSFAPYMDERLLLIENFGDIPDRAHNVALQWMVDFGLIGFGIFVFGLGWMLLYVGRGIRQLGRTKKDFESALYAAAGMAGVAGVFVAGMFGFTVTSHMVGLSFLVAMIFGILGKRFKWKMRQLKGRLGMLFGIVIGLMILISFTGANLRIGLADHFFLKGYQGVRSGELYQSLEMVAAADDLNPNQNYYKFYLANVYKDIAKTVMDEDDTVMRMALETSERFAREGVEFSSGYDGVQRLLLAKIYSLEMGVGSAEDFERYYGLASEEFEAIRSLAPLYPDGILHEGIFYYLAGEDERAVERFEHYLSISPVYWQYQLEPEIFEEDEGAYDRMRLFYKANPRFDEVFGYMEDSYRALGNTEKADYYGRL